MQKFKSLTLISTLGLSYLLSGCASITSSSGQAVNVETVSKSEQLVQGAHCKLTNDKGSWEVKTPATITVQKSGADLVVHCTKSGLEDGTARVISSAGAGMWGNIIFGGGVGAIIDHSKGVAYNYPGVIKVTMGEANVIPSPKNKAKKK